jgi:tetratricopeptide (TPR) repeat protein
MSELRDLIDEAKTSLQNLDNLLRTAKSLGQVQRGNSALSRHELQKYFEEILKMVVALPENLRLEENIQQKGDVMNLLLQMEEVRNEVEQSLGQVEAACKQNLIKLSNVVAALCHPTPTKTQQDQSSSEHNDLLQQGKTHCEYLETSQQRVRQVQDASKGAGSNHLAWQGKTSLEKPIADSAKKSGRKKLIIAWLVGANLLLVGVLGMCLLLSPTGILTGSFEIQSVPEGANVLIDEGLKGQTPLRLESIDAGDYDLRIEKKGYVPLTRELLIEKGQATRLYVQLQKLNILPADPEIRREAAQALFSHSVRNVSPRDAEVLAKLKTLKKKPTERFGKANPGDAGLTKRIQGLHREISSAISSGNYFPPSPANAIQLLKQLNDLSPEDTFGKEELDQIYRELTSLLQRQLQAGNIENARTIARQLQTYFPERLESRSLQDTLKAEETKLLEAQEAWIQKVESGMTAGRYVTPPNDNVLFYCNRALLTNPQNPELLQLRKESINKAAAQANDWVQVGKFDEAREIYSILLQLSQNENRFPFTPQELKRRLDKLEFNAYPVVHDHIIGSCTGRLRMNGFVISFVPTGDSKDGFTQKLAEIAQAEPGDKLKIQFKNKTYRFQVNLVTSKEDKREKVDAIYQNLSRLMATAK